MRRVRALGYRAHLANHITYLVCVLNDDLVSLFLTEILEFLKHLLCGSEVKMDISVAILELHSREQNFSVYFILFVKEMRVAGRNYGLIVLFTESNDLSVQVAKSLVVSNRSLCDKKSVIAYRLDLEIIVEVYDILDLSLGSALKNCSEKLARLAGRANDKSLAVLLKLGLWYSRLTAIIGQIAR